MSTAGLRIPITTTDRGGAIDTTVLIGAIGVLFAALSAMAKLAWAERASRIEACETQTAYYRDEVPKIIAGVQEGQKKQDESLNHLADVVEEALTRFGKVSEKS